MCMRRSNFFIRATFLWEGNAFLFVLLKELLEHIDFKILIIVSKKLKLILIKLESCFMEHYNFVDFKILIIVSKKLKLIFIKLESCFMEHYNFVVNFSLVVGIWSLAIQGVF
jgi:hypothetical protein